jgi:hypothetical protein
MSLTTDFAALNRSASALKQADSWDTLVAKSSRLCRTFVAVGEAVRADYNDDDRVSSTEDTRDSAFQLMRTLHEKLKLMIMAGTARPGDIDAANEAMAECLYRIGALKGH